MFHHLAGRSICTHHAKGVSVTAQYGASTDPPLYGIYKTLEWTRKC